MTANGLKSMLMTFEKVLNGEIPLDPDSVNTLMLGGIVAVLEETRGLGKGETAKTRCQVVPSQFDSYPMWMGGDKHVPQIAGNGSGIAGRLGVPRTRKKGNQDADGQDR